MTESTLQGTPVNVDRFKPVDPSRLPNIQIRATAVEKRGNMIKDCPDCTILMWYAQYKMDVLGSLVDEFDVELDPDSMWQEVEDSGDETDEE